MDGVTLKFHSQELEKAYDAHLARNGALQGDITLLRVVIVLHAGALLRFTLVSPSIVLATVGLFGVVHAACEIYYRRTASFEALVESRTKVVMLHRAVITFIFIMSAMFDEEMATDLVGLAMRSGIIMSLLGPPNARLKVRHHLPCHCASTLLILYFTSRSSCSTVLQTEENHVIIPIAQTLDLVAKRIMAVWGLDIDVASVVHPCLHVIVWFHIFFLLTMGSGFFWLKERTSRVEFVRNKSAKERKDLGLCDVRPLPCWMVFFHLGLLTNFFAVTWMFSYFLVGLVHSWGWLGS